MPSPTVRDLSLADDISAKSVQLMGPTVLHGGESASDRALYHGTLEGD